MRIGLGNDLHRLVEGRPLILSGVKIPYDFGLLGHSDGDVVFHSVADALLSAIGEKDIGNLFPPSDPSIAGINSRKILEAAYKKVTEAGYIIANVSIVITAERPKLAKYIDAFKESIVTTLKVEASQIGITCKTNEGLGYLGQGQAIACQAIVLLED